MTRVESIWSQIMELTPPEFRELCEKIDDSHAENHGLVLSPEELEEIDRRAEEMESGAVKGLDAEEVIASLQASLRERWRAK